MLRLLPLIVMALVTSGYAAPGPDEVKAALVRATHFFQAHAAIHGGYVYRYSADFSLREAEGIPGPDTIWVQPPGTPAVGQAMLDAHLATGDVAALAAATQAARALARTQLVTGGWNYYGSLGGHPRDGQAYARNSDGTSSNQRPPAVENPGWHEWKLRKFGKTTFATLDDDVTQAATRFLLRMNAHLQGADAELAQASRDALATLLRIQYPAGGWSASFDSVSSQPPSVERYPVLSASYPAEWPRSWPKDFTGCYVLNDNLHATALGTLLLAAELTDDAAARSAARLAGDFLLRAQMPDPQPAWAQQYDERMQPCWSRAFEPSSISGRESQSAMWALLKLSQATGDAKYLAPLPRAIAYLKSSLLPNGKLARFYELRSNKPLYFQRGKGGKGFVLTYDSTNASSNYGWEWESELAELQAAYDALRAGKPPVYPPTEKDRWSSAPSTGDVAAILAAQSPYGAWAEERGDAAVMRGADGKKVSPPGGVIYSLTFTQNVQALCAWLNAQSR
jgi:hypothetical protein